MTEYGKYRIESDGTYSMYILKPKSKGSIPKSLSGSYLSVGEAKKAIDRNERMNKKVKNAKTISSSGV